MAEPVSIHVVRKGELRDPARASGWDDPHGLAGMTERSVATYLGNPHSGSDDDPVQILGLRGRLVIGRINLVRGRIKLAVGGPGAPPAGVPILWGSSWFVPEEFRDTMVAVHIILKWQSLAPVVGVVGVSQMALPIYQKLKWTEFSLARRVLIRRSRAVVERYLGRGLHARLARVGVDAGLAVNARLLRLWRRSSLRRLRVERADSVARDLEEAMGRFPGFPVAPDHSPAWLGWLLGNSFGGALESARSLHIVRAADDGKVLGYFLIKHRFYAVATHRQFRDLRLGSLQDWETFDPSRLSEEDIAALATRRLLEEGVDAVEVCCPAPALTAALKRRGYLSGGSLAVLFKARKDSPLADARFAESGAWRLRPADGDNFFA